jgi:hypothetical protein
MKEPNYAPTYMALYPELAAIARKHGYALAIHGTLARDMDLVCIPWVDDINDPSLPSKPQEVVDEITKTFYIREVGGPPSRKPHNRLTYSISVGHGDCAIDLSFMSRTNYVDDGDKRDRVEREINNLSDFLATKPKKAGEVDPRAWEQLLIYVPKDILINKVNDIEWK